jgi:hypothetical protein
VLVTELPHERPQLAVIEKFARVSSLREHAPAISMTQDQPILKYAPSRIDSNEAEGDEHLKPTVSRRE